MELSPINHLLSFTIDHTAIVGRMIKLDKELSQILDLHQYPENVSRLVAEAIALLSIISSTIQDFSVLSLQIKSTGDSPIKAIMADCYADGRVRGYADFNQNYFLNDYLEKKKKIQDYFGQQAVITINSEQKQHSQQTIIELRGNSLTESIEHYYNFIQQIPARFKVAIGKVHTDTLKDCWCLGGIMVQSVPSDSHHAQVAQDDWSEISAIFDTTEEHELLDLALPITAFLSELFFEHTITIHNTINLKQGCQCNLGKFDELYHKLILDDPTLLKKHNKVVIKCEFCSSIKNYTMPKKKK